MQIYVAVNGHDSNPGTWERPLQTPAAARDAARTCRRGEGVEIYFRGGAYTRSTTFELTGSDSGTAAAPIIYRAYKNEKVYWIGGTSIPPVALVPVTDKSILQRLSPAARPHLLQVDLSTLGLTDFGEVGVPDQSPELFFNEQPMPLARWPNQGFSQIQDVLKQDPVVSHSLEGDRKGGLICDCDGDRLSRWRKEADHLRLHGFWFWDWAESYEKVAAIDPEKKVIHTAPPYHIYGYRKGQRFYALNLLCELDTPGEWFLDRQNGILYFWPPEPLEPNTEIVISTLKTPLIQARDASFLTFSGLTLKNTCAMAVSIAGGTGICLEDCTILNTGGDGVVIESGSNHGVRHCEISQTGKSGIDIRGGDRRRLVPAGNYAENNHIHHFSRIKRTYSGAILLHGVGNRAVGNHLHDAPHLAILFGGNDNLIERNHVHHVCCETGDVGVFYTGRDWTQRGTVIRYNFIHHATGPGMYGAQGVYLDDAASGIVVFGNVIFQTSRAMLIGGGRDNQIENNIIIDCDEAIRVDNRGLNWMCDHVDPGGCMRQRLAALPYHQPPWARRYPELVSILQDSPATPKGNRIRDNVLQNSGELLLAEEVIAFGCVEDNLCVDAPLVKINDNGIQNAAEAFAEICRKLPDFLPIPQE